jgi:hypothetical protein
MGLIGKQTNMTRWIKTERGQVILVVVGAVGTILTSLVGAWATANGTARDQISDVRVEVATIKATQNAQYNEIINRLDSIDNKLDQ